MDILLLVFLALIIIILFSVRKPARRMLSARNLANDLMGINITNPRKDNENHVAKVLTSISDSMKSSNDPSQDLVNDRARINNLIKDIKQR